MRRYLTLASLIFLSGCGVTAPQINEMLDGPGEPEDLKNLVPPYSPTMQIEFEIRRKVYCELKDAVQHVNYFPLYRVTPEGKRIGQRLMIPREWIAQISLSLQVDESSALSPGVTFNEVMQNAVKTFGVGNTVTVNQMFNLGLGGTVSSASTRVDKFNPTYSIDWLMNRPTKDSTCDDRNDIFKNQYPRSSPFLIESQLGLYDWLMGAMQTENYLPSHPAVKITDAGASPIPPRKPQAAGPGGNGGGGNAGPGAGADKGGSSLGPFSVSLELKFVIVSSGNITPTWKLLRVSANTSGTLFSTGRTRTHDLIMTVGPASGDTTSAKFSLEVQSAVQNGVRAGLAAQ
jgi:hypothetical protein